jgi:hypothetical protein
MTYFSGFGIWIKSAICASLSGAVMKANPASASRATPHPGDRMSYSFQMAAAPQIRADPGQSVQRPGSPSRSAAECVMNSID